MGSFFKSFALTIQSSLCGLDRTVQSDPLIFQSYNHYPVFILGAPRSGSTLLYQLLLRYFDTAYISNLMALVPSRMIHIARIQKRFYRVTRIRESHFGFIRGLFSPSEAGAVQRFWFEKDWPAEEIDRLRNTMILLSNIWQGPLIIKNLFNLLRLDRIRRIFPEARFIHIRRNYSFNAQSLLLARRRNNGNEHIWWSIKPEGYKDILNQPPEYQVVWQIMETEKRIGHFCSQCKPVEHIHIEYEDLCHNTAETLQKVSDWLGVHWKKNIAFDKLSIDRRIKISTFQWHAIQNYIKEWHLNPIKSQTSIKNDSYL